MIKSLDKYKIVSEFNNTIEDWLSLFVYVILAPFAVLVGSVLMVGCIFCVALYIVFDFLYKVVVYFYRSLKNFQK